MDLGLTGQTALITGAASGIGRATAELMAFEGARIIGVDRDKEGLDATIGSLSPVGGDLPHIAIPADLASAGATAAAMQDAVAAAGSAIDVVIPAAGQCQWRTLAELSDQDWLDTINLNFLAVVRMMSVLLPAMTARGRGSIVLVSSDLARQPEAGPADYQVSKVGLLAYMASLAAEAAPAGIRVNAVAPGLVASPMTYRRGGLADRLADLYGVDQDTAVRQELERRGQLLGRPAAPEEIARVIAFLASGAASYIERSVVTADGGSYRGL